MPIIMVNMLEGRTASQKRALMRELSDGVVRALAVPEQSIRIVLTEVSPEHWGVGPLSKSENQGN